MLAMMITMVLVIIIMMHYVVVRSLLDDACECHPIIMIRLYSSCGYDDNDCCYYYCCIVVITIGSVIPVGMMMFTIAINIDNISITISIKY